MLSRPERDALVERYREYARALALKIAKDLPRFVSRDDLIAVGQEGLVEAASRFDPTRGVQFSTFAYYRVRGAVFDHVRKLAKNDPYVRARASAGGSLDDFIENSVSARTHDAGAGPAEAAEALADILDAAAVVFTVTDCAQALVSDGSRSDTEEDAGRLEAAKVVRAAMEKLPKKERTLVNAVYFEGATIEEAGQQLGLSKSWASRLHARALGMLRDAVGELGE
jgi:RNA polymerase sigma factor for flagellar operon FliA